MKIGFIGLGIMGSRMAANLLRGGHDLTVFNRTASRADDLAREGASVARTPGEAARDREVVMTMLADPDAVEAVAAGDEGFVASMSGGSIWVDFSTVNPSFTRRMAHLAESRGIALVDAPVAGTRGPAERGELTILAGGDAGVVAKLQPLFDLVGRKTVHTGGVGTGTSTKMVVNLMLAGAMAAYSEALTLGEGLGIARETVADALIGGPVAAPFLAAKRGKIEAGDYDTEFPLRLMQKDLHLAATEAFEHGVALPATNAVKELYAVAVRMGLGDLDFSAVYEALNPKRR